MSALNHFTILSDEEVEAEEDSEQEEEEEVKVSSSSKKSKDQKHKKKAFAIDFDNGDLYNRVYNDDNENTDSSEEDDEDDEGEDEDEDDVAEDNVRAMPRAEERAARAIFKAEANISSQKAKLAAEASMNASDGYVDNGMDAETEKVYFESIVDDVDNDALMFTELNLSRPFLRAIEAIGYTSPTPIQAKVIPLAMAGRDICASAITGSGKTAAFVLPFLERLVYRPMDTAAIRVLIVTPTRELATQIYDVLTKLAQFTDITSCIICGGKKDLKSQEATLRNRPDVVVCTPGRIIDHLRNSHSVNIDDLDVLVLDEVDRLLDLGFQEEVEELVKFCPHTRQTMLFSATMTPKVEDLVKLSLKRPVRVKTSNGSSTVAFNERLIQEFVKVRNAEAAEAILVSLVLRNFRAKTIVFYEMKKDAHRFCAILQLLDVKVSELHGDIPQDKRYSALQRFRTGQSDVLVATDVAARGLDIPGVLTVINAEMPRNTSTYVHRVGRTARAGCGGRAITLVTDARRKIMKEVLKGVGGTMSQDGGQVLSRTIPAAVIQEYIKKVEKMEKGIEQLFRDEKMKNRLDNIQQEVEKAENLLEYQDEIEARPARTWYQSEAEKRELKEVAKTKVKQEQDEARLGKETAAREAMTANDKAIEMARLDDYRMEEKRLAKRGMGNRKKRRRLEALEESQKADEEDRQRRQAGGGGDDEEEDDSSKKKTKKKGNGVETEKHVLGKGESEKLSKYDLSAKRSKVSKREKGEDYKELTLGNMFMKRVRVESSNRSTTKEGEADGVQDGDTESGKTHKMKVVRQKFAVGGLDQDMADWAGGADAPHMSKKQQKKEKEFSEFDPNKRLKKGGKGSSAGFKSKSKYKRR